jgi:hypothetical protein
MRLYIPVSVQRSTLAFCMVHVMRGANDIPDTVQNKKIRKKSLEVCAIGSLQELHVFQPQFVGSLVFIKTTK